MVAVARRGGETVGVADVEGALQSPALLYDKAGDQHYWLISAFIKSIRGSDPDAGIYWLARMLEAGEDPLFVARRLVVLAAEDVGLADPQALSVAVAAQQAAHFVGMPEGYLPLAEATLYLALAPKSNSALRAYGAARQDVLDTLHEPVPLHLRNAVTAMGRAMGFGAGYRYAHDEPGGVAEQQHLPGPPRRPALLRARGARGGGRHRAAPDRDPAAAAGRVVAPSPARCRNSEAGCAAGPRVP